MHSKNRNCVLEPRIAPRLFVVSFIPFVEYAILESKQDGFEANFFIRLYEGETEYNPTVDMYIMNC